MRAKALGLAAAVALAALLPLYGDPTPTAAVSHAEWARLLLRGLSILSDERGVNDTAAQAFATLSGRDSRSFTGDRYVRGTRVEAAGDDAIRAVGGIGEAVYALGVARPGDYRLRLQVAGGEPAEAEIKRAGDAELLRSFPVPTAVEKSWVDAGVVHLDPGAYDASVLLPAGATLDYLELAPPCLSPIEPPGGWKASAIATTSDVAVTVLQALDLESELPPSDTAVELPGSALRTDAVTATEATATLRFSGGPHGLRAVLEVVLPEDGLYTLSVFGEHRGGQRWLADGCRKSIVCPAVDGAPGWRVILSGEFQKGPHVFDVVVGPDTVVDRIQIEPKKHSPEDYLATVARLGLDLGPDGPITREKADEARQFLQRQRLERERALCGDILEPGTLIAELASGAPGGGEGGGPGGPGGGGPGGGGPGGGGTVPPPVIPPLPPASPTMPTTFLAGGSR